MKNHTQWKPTKFIYKKGKLCAAPHPFVSPASRNCADIIASFYQHYLPIYAKGHLLDLGCGHVPLYHVYKSHITKHTCADWENTQHKNPFIDSFVDLEQEIPFEDNVFDTVILSDVLEHISNPHLVWRELHRILKPDGILILNVPFYYWLHEDPHDYHRYTEYALQKYAETNHFEVLHLEPYGGSPEIILDIITKHMLFIPKIGKRMARLTQSLLIPLLKCSPIKHVSKRSRQRFPFGYFMVSRNS